MSAVKPVVLICNLRYLPGFKGGGPIRSLTNMVDRLSGYFDFHVITLDRDLGDTHAYTGVPIETWCDVGKARVFYIPKRRVTFRRLAEVVRRLRPSVVYLNSFLDPTFTQHILWLRRLGALDVERVIVAPRGELSVGALGIKRWKKRPYLWFVRHVGLTRGAVWHVTAAPDRAELQDSGLVGAGDEVCVARNLSPASPQFARADGGRDARSGAVLRICFLSRIARNKNLDFALRVLARITRPVVFTIYGPREDRGYWRECEDLIAALPQNVVVHYAGVVEPDDVVGALCGHDLFFLPTRGENYGHVIREALSAGLVALISDKTPWRDLESARVGWTVPLDAPERFAELIDAAAGWTSAEWSSRRSACSRYIETASNDEVAVRASYEMLSGAAAPDSVGRVSAANPRVR